MEVMQTAEPTARPANSPTCGWAKEMCSRDHPRAHVRRTNTELLTRMRKLYRGTYGFCVRRYRRGHEHHVEGHYDLRHQGFRGSVRRRRRP